MIWSNSGFTFVIFAALIDDLTYKGNITALTATVAAIIVPHHGRPVYTCVNSKNLSTKDVGPQPWAIPMESKYPNWSEVKSVMYPFVAEVLSNVGSLSVISDTPVELEFHLAAIGVAEARKPTGNPRMVFKGLILRLIPALNIMKFLILKSTLKNSGEVT